METVLLSAGVLKKFMVTKPSGYVTNYAWSSDNGIVYLSEPSVFSPLVKIEVERATNPKYVHLLFSHNNRYWGRGPEEGASMVPLLAESSEPEEDTTKLSCTLFEAVRARNDPTNTLFNLIHVQSGGYVMGLSSRLYLRMPIPSPVVVDPKSMNLTSLDWEELIKLPKKIALAGYNDKYLGGRGRNYLQLSYTDGKAKECIHEVHLMNDGHVRIKSMRFDRFWRRDKSNWIVADATNTAASARDRDTLFWPVLTADNTIALRNAGNNQFCVAVNNDYLAVSSRTMTDKAMLIVEELVLQRRIYNVRYRVDNGRVFGEGPYVAGTTTARNDGYTEASSGVEVSYEDSRSETFGRSISVTAGVQTTFIANVPFIGKSEIEIKLESTFVTEWNNTATKTITVKATGSVMLPPRTVADIDYVGMRGTCDVPFSYTQRELSAIDGKWYQSEEIDGVFRGVNAYDFSFIIKGTRSLPLSDEEEVMLPAATQSSDSEAQ